MRIETRNQKIAELYIANPVENDIFALAKRFNLTEERIKQILIKDEIEKQKYKEFQDQYINHIHSLTEKQLHNEMVRLRGYDRSKHNVFRRMVCIAAMHDKYDKSFTQIGMSLLRHHSSVINLYEKFQQSEYAKIFEDGKRSK